MNKLRIAIVGAGPGGLTLARILHLGGVDAVVFERERLSSARPQEAHSICMSPMVSLRLSVQG